MGLGAILVGCTQAPQAPQAETSQAKQATQTEGGEPVRFTLEGEGAPSIIVVGTKVTGRHEIRIPVAEISASATPDCITSGKVVLDLTRLENLDMKGEWKDKFEKHLKSPDFFDVEKYPQDVFEITGCEKASGDTVYLSGNLTLRGVTKGIRVPARYTFTEGKLTLEANFNINRQEWGIAYKGKPDDLIRDEVNVQVRLQGQI